MARRVGHRPLLCQSRRICRSRVHLSIEKHPLPTKDPAASANVLSRGVWSSGYHRDMDSPRRGLRSRGHRDRAAVATDDGGSRGIEPVDHDRFPDLETRRAIDGGAASQRFRDLLAESGPILADGAMGTMLFANGLQFGDPPEVWNLTSPDVVRRIHRGYLDAGARIVLTNTVGGNRRRLALTGHERRVEEFNRTAAILLRSEIQAAGGTALAAGDIGPTGEIMAPLGTLDEHDAVDAFAEQAAALIAG